MKPKTMYLALCLPGTALPYWQFAPWVASHGVRPGLLLHDLFANRVSGFFALDVVVSAVVLLVFVLTERHRAGVRQWWLPVLAVLTVGVSLALPLFLYLRELGLERKRSLQRNSASA
jgi:hypothetical protein